MIRSLWHLIPESFRQILRDARFTARSYATNLESLSGFLLFVGNSRSGTTLVRTLLDAHPAIVLGNEVHSVKRLEEGRSWHSVVGRILVNSERFSRNPVWTGYSYRMTESPYKQKKDPIRIIGDKKAAHTADLLATNPDILTRLLGWAPVPVYLVQCIRNPMDAIATLAHHLSLPLPDATRCYFTRHETSIAAMSVVGDTRFYQLYLEDLIANPETAIRELTSFLGLSVDSNYLGSCSALIYDKPRQSRDRVNWPPGLAAYIHTRMGQDQYLARYSGISDAVTSDRCSGFIE